MKRVLRWMLVIMCVIGIAPAIGFCGGDWTPVQIKSINRSGDSDYVLILQPISPDTISYKELANCKFIEIRGTYSWWHSWRSFPEWVNRKLHGKSLTYLEDAQTSKKIINFGWMGRGLEKAEEPCVYMSRALELYRTEGQEAVISYY